MSWTHADRTDTITPEEYVTELTSLVRAGHDSEALAFSDSVFPRVKHLLSAEDREEVGNLIETARVGADAAALAAR